MRYILCVIYMFFSVTGLTCIKLGSNNVDAPGINIPILDINLNKISIIGILCYGVSFLLYLGVISKFDLGVIIPIVGGVVNIAILFVSLFLLKETLSINMIVGAIVIIIGIVIMNIKS